MRIQCELMNISGVYHIIIAVHNLKVVHTTTVDQPSLESELLLESVSTILAAAEFCVSACTFVT